LIGFDSRFICINPRQIFPACRSYLAQSGTGFYATFNVSRHTLETVCTGLPGDDAAIAHAANSPVV
jgi:hypothetical protein